MNFLFLRMTDELQRIVAQAKKLSGLQGSGELLEAAERTFISLDDEEIDISSLFAKGLHTAVEEDTLSSSPLTMRIPIKDEKLDEEATDKIRRIASVSRVRAAYKLRLVLLIYINCLTSGKPLVAPKKSPAADDVEKIGALKLQIIELVMQQSNKSLLEYLLSLLHN